MAVVVAMFVSPPAFAYIAVRRYLSSLGSLIPHGGRPVTGVGLDSLALVFIGDSSFITPPPCSLAPPPPYHVAGPPSTCLAPPPLSSC